MKKGDLITFYTPAKKKGKVLSVIPANVNRDNYIFDILNSDIDYEIRVGSVAQFTEVSYLVEVKGPCGSCRKRLYHVPESALNELA